MSARLTTSSKGFGLVGCVDKKTRLFNVTDGIDAEDALERASAMMEAIMDGLEGAAMNNGKFDCSHAWLTLHAAESVKAIIDGLWKTLELSQGDEA
jgi:hypothetical protein